MYLKIEVDGPPCLGKSMYRQAEGKVNPGPLRYSVRTRTAECGVECGLGLGKILIILGEILKKILTQSVEPNIYSRSKN